MRVFVAVAVLMLAAMPAAAATYHTGNDCAPLPVYKAPADIAASNTTGTQVELNPSPLAQDLEHVPIGLNVPLGNYVDQNSVNADLQHTDITVGQIDVNTKTGETTLNGRPIGDTQQYPADCGLSGNNIMSTK